MGKIANQDSYGTVGAIVQVFGVFLIVMRMTGITVRVVGIGWQRRRRRKRRPLLPLLVLRFFAS